MACGTPVLATRRGAVPEVLVHGKTGIIVDDYRDMVQAVADARTLNPGYCRTHVEQNFAPERMVQDYIRMYAKLLSV